MLEVLPAPQETLSVDSGGCVALLGMWHNTTAGRFFAENVAPLRIVQHLCGSTYVLYPFWDDEGRVATWIWPILLILGLISIPQLSMVNCVKVYVCVMADPIYAQYSCLIHLEALREYYLLCQDPTLPTASPTFRKALAIVSAASESWEIWFSHGGRLSLVQRTTGFEEKNRRDRVHALFKWANESDDRREACEEAAKKLSKLRRRALFSAAMGIFTFGINTSIAFSHALQGSVNDRTGHSIAFGMLFSWLGVLLFTTCFIPQFVSIDACEDALREMITVDDSPPPIEIPETAKLYRMPGQSIEWPLKLLGLDPTFVTSATLAQATHDTKTSMLLYTLSVLPLTVAMVSAVSISYLNPTQGFDCRSVMQLMFYVVWVLSFGLTKLIVRIYRSAPDVQLQYTVVKNTVFLLPQIAFLVLAYIGWFNSPMCWSAWFSLGKHAYIFIDPMARIIQLVGFEWRLITGLMGLCQLLIVVFIWLRYRRVMQFFSYDTPWVTRACERLRTGTLWMLHKFDLVFRSFR